MSGTCKPNDNFFKIFGYPEILADFAKIFVFVNIVAKILVFAKIFEDIFVFRKVFAKICVRKEKMRTET